MPSGVILATTGVLLAVEPDRHYLLYAVMLVAIVLMGIGVRRRQRQGFGNVRPNSRRRLESLAAEQDVKADMQELLGELSSLARKINAQIDTKFAKLEAAMADADRRIDVLQRLTRTARGEPAVDVTIADEPAELPADGACPEPAVEPVRADRHAAVYALADEGKGPVEIAQTLGRTPGEVELILALRRRRVS